ncbi:MAG TPA: PRC and DUF2382 domain-containing protein [Trebonia sp.]
MTSPQQWDNLAGATAVDSEGAKVGKVGQIYVNDATGEPEWVTVHTGLFGTRESVAPLYGAQPGDGEVRLAATKQLIKDAPSIESDRHLAGDDVDALYQHYAGYTNPASTPPGIGTAGTAETGQAGNGSADEAATGHAMTRSEEQLRVGTESVPAERVRLRKYIVTENVTRVIPVSHEEIRVERVPVAEADRDAALDGPAISEEEHEITLRAERPVVEKETVPVERVRLGTETVTEQQEVSEQVRKERIDEPDVDTRARRDDR